MKGWKIDGEGLRFGNITVVPSVHGRALFALEVRRRFLAESFDCIAVELPPSHRDPLIEAIGRLPKIHAVHYHGAGDEVVYLPVDPCDSIIEAVRLGERERGCRLEFIDAETFDAAPVMKALPDEYALLKLGLPTFYAAVEPFIEAAPADSIDGTRDRIMAMRLRELAARHERVLFVCGMRHAKGIGALLAEPESAEVLADDPPITVRIQPVHDDSLYHVLGELPWNTWLYEQIRHSITLEEFEPIFGLKNLLLSARERMHERYRDEIHQVSPQNLQSMLTYIRNLCLTSGYLTPALYDIVVAAKGIGGSAYAVELIDIARCYGELPPVEQDLDEDELDDDLTDSDLADVDEEDDGDDEREPGARGPGAVAPDPTSSLPDWLSPEDDAPPWRESLYADSGPPPEMFDHALHMTEREGVVGGKRVPMRRRLSTPPKIFRRIKLEKTPSRRRKKAWKKAWDENRSVSWPPEDQVVEDFAGYVRKRALKLTSLHQVRTEEFQSSLMDGLHIKETLRNFHLGKLYVKVEPRLTGDVGAVVIIFEEDLDEGRFPWKITWYAEHENESTLSFYATAYEDNFVGPGIARSLYGGSLFIYPPKAIPDVWQDRRLKAARSSMETLVFGAAMHANDKYIAYVSPKRPTDRMKRFCDEQGRKLIYLPLSSFSRSTLWKLRTFHVLNGREVRSWAARYIR